MKADAFDDWLQSIKNGTYKPDPVLLAKAQRIVEHMQKHPVSDEEAIRAGVDFIVNGKIGDDPC